MTSFSDESAILESHYYGANGSAIKYSTRNICAESTAKILEELATILFPQEEIEIYVIPAQDGCHQDSFWIKVQNNTLATGLMIAFFTAVATLPSHISQIITDTTTREMNRSQTELNLLQAEQIKSQLNEIIPDNNISIDQCQSILTNREIKKQRSRHFEQLKTDGEIRKEKFIAKNNANDILQEKVIESIDFGDYIGDSCSTESTIKIVEKIHKLTVIQPVNEREHKDLSWQVEDFNQKQKFGVYMMDETFYNLHFENIFGLKTITARVKYTAKKDSNGLISFPAKNKEIIAVYGYNQVERIPLPINENIEPAPFKFDENFESESKSNNDSSIENMRLFSQDL